MKSLMWLTGEVLHDCGTRCGAEVLRDLQTISERVENEGESFLTITLPSFASGLERALREGRLLRSHTPAFSWHKRGLPKFLRGFLQKVFDSDGLLLPNACSECIACIRQACLLHKKILRPCSEERETKALEQYKKCEYEVKNWTETAPTIREISDFRAVARIVWTDLLSNASFGDIRPEIHPHHGPGATEERVHGNSKYMFTRWHSRLEEHFPFTEYGLASVRNDEDMASRLEKLDIVEPQDENPVRVVFVPKTQKTPRVIAIEPVCMQYIQQGILRWLVPRIERGRYTAGQVNFTDQSVNQKLALVSSKDSRFATMDLSEASDRVSSYLVDAMLESVPLFREHVFACRSTRAKLPDSTIVELSKFASMGSALCFPMEAMVFFCIIVAARIRNANRHVTPRSVQKYSRDVYVYGDDLLVPSDEAPFVGHWLSIFGLKVNENKSFWTGKFRESCGTDAYNGDDVTPVYARYECPADKQHADAIVSWVSMANQFYLKGFWKTTKALRGHLDKLLGGLPFLSPQSQGLSWNSYSNWIQGSRWSKDLMRFEVRTYVPSSVWRQDCIDGDSALLKCFSTIGSSEPMDKEHLKRVAARGKLTLKRRWVPAY